MNFRKARKQDLDLLSVLFDNYRVFYEKESNIKAANQFLSNRIIKMDSEIFVAENSDNELLGFVQLYPLFSSTKMRKLWLLNDLYVAKEFRGQGVSIGLIKIAKQLVIDSGACGMYLETDKSNLIGNKLYPKTGFVLNEHSNYFEWNH